MVCKLFNKKSSGGTSTRSRSENLVTQDKSAVKNE